MAALADAPHSTTTHHRPEIHRHAGRTVRVLTDGERTSGSHSIFEVSADDGAGLPAHLHRNEDERVLVLEGRVAVTLDGVEHVLERHEELDLPREVPHRVRPVDGPARYLMTCTPSGIESFIRATSEPDEAQELSADDLAAHMAVAGLQLVRDGSAS